jgi:hypothetical protein
MARRAWLILGAEAVATAAFCAGLVVAAPHIYARYRRRRGW